MTIIISVLLFLGLLAWYLERKFEKTWRPCFRLSKVRTLNGKMASGLLMRRKSDTGEVQYREMTPSEESAWAEDDAW